MKNAFLFFLILSSFTGFSSNSKDSIASEEKVKIGDLFLLPNETLIFSFKTNNNKILTLCTDKNFNYLVYRFGTSQKVELQYPEVLDKTSWDKFYFYSYHRGGGIDNAGLDIDVISFTNHKTTYAIHDEWAIDKEGEHEYLSIEIDDLSTALEVDFKISGLTKSKRGNLMNFRHGELNELINTLEKEDAKKTFSGWEPETKYALGNKTIKVYENPSLDAKIVDELYNGDKVSVVTNVLEETVPFYYENDLELWGKFVRIKYIKKDSNLFWGYVIYQRLSNYRPLFLSDTSEYNLSERFLLTKLRKVATRDHQILLKTQFTSFGDFYNQKKLYGINQTLYQDLQLDKIHPFDSNSIQKFDPTGGEDLISEDHFELLYSFNGTADLSPNFYSIIIGYDYYNEYDEYIVNYSKDGKLIDFLLISTGDNVESFEYTSSLCFIFLKSQ